MGKKLSEMIEEAFNMADKSITEENQLEITDILTPLELLDLTLLLLGNEGYFTEQKRIRDYRILKEEKRKRYALLEEEGDYTELYEPVSAKLEELLGTCYPDLTGDEAIKKIMELSSNGSKGFCPNAFSRNGLLDINRKVNIGLTVGDEGCGFEHILDRRGPLKAQVICDAMEEVIKYGNVSRREGETGTRYNIEKDGVIISIDLKFYKDDKSKEGFDLAHIITGMFSNNKLGKAYQKFFHKTKITDVEELYKDPKFLELNRKIKNHEI